MGMRIGYGEAQLTAALRNIYYLRDKGLKKGKRFTGAMVGIYVFAGEGTAKKILVF